MRAVVRAILNGLLSIILASTAAWASPILSIQPSTTVVLPGSAFNLNVNIEGATDLFAFQFDLTFAPHFFTATGASEGSFLAGGGGNTFFFPGRITNDAIAVADTLLGTGPGVFGTGQLATVNFTALGGGTTRVTFSNVLLLDSSLHEIGSTSVPAVVTAVPEPITWTLLVVGLLAIASAYRSSRRVSAAVLFLGALALPLRAAAPGYKFTVLARDGDTIGGKTIAVPLHEDLVINNAGVVVFAASFHGGSGFSFFTPSSLLVATGDTIGGKILTSIADSSGSYDVNDTGAVVFEADLRTGIFTQSELIAQTGGTFRGKTLMSVWSPRINNSGIVVFSGRFDTFGFDAGVFKGSELLVTAGDTIAGKTLTGIGIRPAITDNGTVMFVGEFSGGTGVFTPSELLLRLPAKGDVIGGKTLTEDAVFFANINKAGIVTFELPFVGGSGLFTPSELIFDYGKPIGGQTIEFTNGYAVSNGGTLVVRGIIAGTPITQGHGAGLFKKSELIIASGDTIDGKTLRDVLPPAINDAGVIVFTGEFSDGSHAIITATPISTGIEGDVNGDGIVDCADLDLVKASMGTRFGQAGFDPRADANGDGIVNIRDLAFVAQKLPSGTTCP